jgi:enamine deaminase RidA (YjgF/YER057c/UK114 family)
MDTLLPPGWPRPTGYSNGIAASGRLVFVAGQIGWDREQVLVGDRLADQVRQALENTVAVLQEAGARPEHVVRITWFITDKEAYLRDRAQVGAVYREIMGKHFPAMSLLIVKDLLEDGALVEIETTAVVPA